MKCKKCGGNRTKEKCNLCELFATGLVPDGMRQACWPIKCEALACHPKQVDECNQRAKRHGINVEYDRQGFCHIPDQGNYAKILKLERMYNKSEGFHGA